MKNQKSNYLILLMNILGDVFAVTLSYHVAYIIRFYTFFKVYTEPQYLPYAKALIVILPVYFFCFRAYGLYQTTRHKRRIEEMFLVIKASTLSVIILMAVTFFYRDFSYSRAMLIKMWALSIFFVAVVRYLLIQFEYARKRRNKQITRLLLAGANRNARSIIQWAKNSPHYGVQIVGVLSREKELVGKHLEGISIIGVVDQCESFIESLAPDEVVLLDRNASRERLTELVIACEDKMVDFKIGADFYGIMSRNVDVEYFSSVPLLGFRPLPLDDPWNRFLKRTFDIVVTTAILFVTAPLWLLVIAAIKLCDGGPILYKQERMGRDRKIFNVLKFRTMRVNAEQESGPVWAKANDDRRTPIGGFLRRWNIDELPQLFNVLRGDMSLVGPRPEREHFIQQFRGAIPRYMTRHKIKSGLTGWAQVSGYRGNTSIQERTKYDLYYMENWSILFDIEILLMTFFAFKNAY